MLHRTTIFQGLRFAAIPAALNLLLTMSPLQADPKEPDLIKTIRGGGYVFAAPVTLDGQPW